MILENWLNDYQNKSFFIKAKISKEMIKETYIKQDLPWIIGYSGGKDSTLLVELIIESLKEIPSHLRTKKICILSSDTLVENPLVINRVRKSILEINKYTKKFSLPIKANIITPDINETFWVNLLGKGYPAPNQTFRWCTSRLKINSMSNYVFKNIDKDKKVIYVIGVRQGESLSRDRVLKKFQTIDDKYLNKHSIDKNAFVFKPILDFKTKELWEYLIAKQTTTWGESIGELYEMYRESSNECPLALDMLSTKNQSFCGNSRWGCWTCTVVKNDKSVNNLINSGYTELAPLRQFRDLLVIERDDFKNRYLGSHRISKQTGKIIFINKRIMRLNISKNNPSILFLNKKNNRPKKTWEILNDNSCINLETNDNFQIISYDEFSNMLKTKKINMWEEIGNPLKEKIIIKKNGKYFLPGIGPYTIIYRKEKLRQLIELQEKTGQNLISNQEIKLIKNLWKKIKLNMEENDV